jgi:hypothetical protein
VGYGKSEVICFLASSYSWTRRRVWFLPNRSAVVDQLADATSGLADVTVLTVQTADVTVLSWLFGHHVLLGCLR